MSRTVTSRACWPICSDLSLFIEDFSPTLYVVWSVGRLFSNEPFTKIFVFRRVVSVSEDILTKGMAGVHKTSAMFPEGDSLNKVKSEHFPREICPMKRKADISQKICSR